MANIGEKVFWRPRWTIEKYNEKMELYAIEEFNENILLDAGITELLTNGASGFLYLGVGDDDTAASAEQTGLQAAVNKAYAGMEGGYPDISDQSVAYRASFGDSEAAFDWKEFIAITGDGIGTALNRKVEDHGTKASADTWVLTLTVTLS